MAEATRRLVIMMGLQASGKSSFTRTHLAGSHVVLSKDDWPNARNRQRRLLALVRAHLEAGDAVVVDNTNPSPSDREPLIAAARTTGSTVVGFWFDSDVESCRRRNEQRTGRQQVPDVGFFATVGKLSPPTFGEGFDELHLVRLRGDDVFDVHDWPDRHDG